MAKMSTTTKVLLVVAAATGTYFVVRGLRKPKADEKKLPAVTPSGEPSGAGLPPETVPNARKPGEAPPFNAELQGAEAGTVNAYHAQWAAGQFENRLRQALGENVTADSVANALTDWAYKEIYGNAASPIPSNWGGTGWAPFAQAWNRMKSQMKPMVVATWAGTEEEIS